MGAFQRLKEHIKAQVETQKGTMFHKGADICRDLLDKMLDNIHRKIEKDVVRIVKSVNSDYTALVTNANVFAEFDGVRDEVRQLLENADTRFKAVLPTGEHIAETGVSTQMAAMTVGENLANVNVVMSGQSSTENTTSPHD